MLQVFYQLLAAVKAVHASVLASLVVHGAVIVHDVDSFQVVPVADFKVVRVVGWGNLHQTSPKFWVNVLVFDDWNFPANQWQDQLLPTKSL